MVKCEKGECIMIGSLIQLAAETGCLVAEVYRKATEFAGPKFAKDVLDTILLGMTDKDVQDSITKKAHMTIDKNSIMEALKNLGGDYE